MSIYDTRILLSNEIYSMLQDALSLYTQTGNAEIKDYKTEHRANFLNIYTEHWPTLIQELGIIFIVADIGGHLLQNY